MKPNSIRVACALAVFLLVVSPLRATGFKLGTPGPEDAPQLVTTGPEPAVRFPVVHQHAASGCGGYLYFSKRTIRYEVLHPDKDKGHSFEYPMSDLVVAKQWTFLATSMPEVEYKFRDGRVFHFFRVKRKMAESESQKFGWDDVLPYEALVDAAMNFDSLLAQVQAANAQMAVAAKAAAGAAAPSATPAVDDTTAMDSAGLDVPPPPPWGQPAAARATAPAAPGNGGRP
ncbi:MAG TPA: hypothetical protein VJW51_04515 [Candidatus Acidoferrales bacterium]|nr:hypothetical protein [Candidatus Acidoferrales bacterium]